MTPATTAQTRPSFIGTRTVRTAVTPVTKVIKHKSTVVSVKLAATGLATASGAVAFSLGSAHLCTATIANGSARCTANKKFNKGQFTVSAKYVGDQFYASASASARFSVK